MKLKIFYDQIPHVISNHPLMTNDAEVVFRNLYKILKDREKCTYSNSALIPVSRCSRKTLDKSLSLLEKIGAITIIGLKQNRRFGRGLLLLSVQESNTYAPDAHVVNNDTGDQLTTWAPDAHAWAPDAHAWAPDAHILIPTIKISTTKTSSVVIISESKDNELRKTYEEFKNHLQFMDIKNVDDMLNYCKWNIEIGKSQGVNENGRFNQIIKFLKAGSLIVDSKWAVAVLNNKNKQLNIGRNGYQEYASKMKASISLGIIPKDTIILKFEEWRMLNG